MTLSRNEVNFIRLLGKCKNYAQEKFNPLEIWRFQAFVQHLEVLFSALEANHSHEISQEMLSNYRRDLDFLNGIVRAEKKEELEEKMLTAQQLPLNSSQDMGCTRTKSNTSNDVNLRQVKSQTTSRYVSDMRQELLGDGGLRLRSAGDGLETDNADIDAVLRHHQDMQTHLAEEFLSMTRSLKENVTVAGHVIKEDKQTLSRVGKKAEDNLGRLEKEGGRLAFHVRRSFCDCWLWFLLLVVMLTFIGMVLLMRLFPKV